MPTRRTPWALRSAVIALRSCPALAHSRAPTNLAGQGKGQRRLGHVDPCTSANSSGRLSHLLRPRLANESKVPATYPGLRKKPAGILLTRSPERARVYDPTNGAPAPGGRPGRGFPPEPPPIPPSAVTRVRANRASGFKAGLIQPFGPSSPEGEGKESYSAQPLSSRRATASITAMPSALSLRHGIAA